MNEELAKKYLESLFENFFEDTDTWYYDDGENSTLVESSTCILLDEIAEFLYRGEAEPIEE